MPFIDDQFVEFNPDVLADAIAAGRKVGPHYYDFENQSQFQWRTQKEYEQISDILKRKNLKAWKKWHGIPDTENIFPHSEWNKLPMRNPGTLAELLEASINRTRG
jgi:hypothetical protein